YQVSPQNLTRAPSARALETTMLSAVMTFRIKPGQMDEFINRWNVSIREIENTPGLGPVYLLTDVQGNRCLSVAIWHKAETGQTWDKSPQLRKFIESVKSLLTADPVRELYQVGATSSQVSSAERPADSQDSMIRSA